MDTLKKLYFGQLNPAGALGTTRDSQNLSLDARICEEKLHLQDALSATDFKRLETLENVYNEYSSLEQCESFAVGFSLAVRLLTEAYARIK